METHNYSIIEMQGFLEKIVKREGEKGMDWLLWVLGTGSKMLLGDVASRWDVPGDWIGQRPQNS